MELRKDYILDRFVIVAQKRGKRPHQFVKKKVVGHSMDKCFFCPGNEELTPKEIGRIGTKDKWSLRWFPNKFPAVDKKGQAEFQTHNNFFTFADAVGFHEVIVETNNPKKQLWDLPKKQVADLLSVYAERIQELSKKPNVFYVSVFKNHGKDAGTSLVHSHSQIIAYNKWPHLVRDKVNAVKQHSSCPYCSIINIEKDSDRRCFENNSFIAFCPYASRFNYEVWIFPKQHILNITNLSEDQLKDMADVLQKVLKKLKKLDCSYNMELFYSPDGENLHFHLELTPRIAVWGGFELATNDIINTVSPEVAAKFFRGE